MLLIWPERWASGVLTCYCVKNSLCRPGIGPAPSAEIKCVAHPGKMLNKADLLQGRCRGRFVRSNSAGGVSRSTAGHKAEGPGSSPAWHKSFDCN